MREETSLRVDNHRYYTSNRSANRNRIVAEIPVKLRGNPDLQTHRGMLITVNITLVGQTLYLEVIDEEMRYYNIFSIPVTSFHGMYLAARNQG